MRTGDRPRSPPASRGRWAWVRGWSRCASSARRPPRWAGWAGARAARRRLKPAKPTGKRPSGSSRPRLAGDGLALHVDDPGQRAHRLHHLVEVLEVVDAQRQLDGGGTVVEGPDLR